MNSTRLRMMVIGALCLGLGSACAKSKSPDVGTNTNWLKQCEQSEDCDNGVDCLCGVCTSSCTSSTSCSELGSAASCAQLSTAMCGANASGSACLPECKRDADCSAIEDGVCRQGHCVPEPQPIMTVPSDGGDVRSEELTRVEALVQIPEGYRTCESNADCTLVGTSCNGCCDEAAIRTVTRATYDEAFAQVCEDYRGPICDCDWRELIPRCQDGLCTAMERDPDTCYSPTQNVERAYELGAYGCVCTTPGLELCTSGAALLCDQGEHGRSYWTALEDGSCEPPVTDCRAVQQRASADSCLSEFATCVELESGMFCGSDCHAPLDCSAVDCRYAPFESCGRFRAYEGLCGDIRYRRLDFIGNTTLYWDEAGDLIALVETSDVGDYCGGGDNVLRRGDLTVIESCEVVTNDTTDLCN